MTNIRRLPIRQRETLMLAEHGDISILKGRGINQVRKALVRKGLLTEHFEITPLGVEYLEAAHAEQRPRDWFHLGSYRGLLASSHAFSPGLPERWGYGSQHWIGSVSADGRTAYAAPRFARTADPHEPVIAIIASSIPSEHREFFGLTPI